MDRRFSPFLSIAFSTLLFAFLCGEATASQEQPDDLERIQDRGRLIVCSYPLIDSPFIRPLEDGAGWTGIDYELMTALATDLGTDLELVIPEDEEGLPSFTAVLPWLLDERCDIVAASLSVTPDRQKQVTFSKAYHRNHMHVVMRPGLCIDNVAELRDRVAAVIPGTVLEPWAAALHLGSTLTAIDQLTIDNLRDDGKLRTSAVDADGETIDFRYTLELFDALQRGHADFTLADENVLGAIAYALEGLFFFRVPDGDDRFALAMRPGADSSRFVDRVDALLARLKSNGTLAAIKARHLKPIPTAPDVCQSNL